MWEDIVNEKNDTFLVAYFIFDYGNPSTYVVSSYVIPRLTSLARRSNVLKKARKSECDAEDIFEFCAPIIKTSPSTILLKFGIKASLKKLKNLNLSLKRGPRKFWIYLRTESGRSWHQGEDADMRKEQAATTGQGAAKMFACCEDIMKKKKKKKEEDEGEDRIGAWFLQPDDFFLDSLTLDDWTDR